MIFLDRSIPKGVAVALQAVRNDVKWLEDLFPHGTPDPAWLAEAGRQGWLVITRDKRIRSRPGERAAIQDHGVGCFIFVQKQNPTRWRYLQLLAARLDEMVRIHQQTARPYIYTIRADGTLHRYI